MLPPRVILVAVDFSESSRVALTCAARLAQQCAAELHVLHAEDPLLTVAAANANVDLTAEMRDELQRFIHLVPPAAALAPCRDVVSGNPVSVILDIAQREGANLIVLGAHGMSGTGRLLFGSVTQGVLLRANRSVLVVPDCWRAPKPDAAGLTGIGPVVVGVDFSEPSWLAAAGACALAECLHASVELLHVVPDLSVPERWRGHADRVLEDRISLARRELARHVQALNCLVPVTTHVEQGNVEQTLGAGTVELGGRHPLLVLGRRSSRSRDGAPGATAFRVASLARVPVLMYESP
jgi:nucleotide-binding universal stress UspA family protein